MPKHSHVRLVEFEHPEDPERRIRVGACHKDPHDPSHTRYEASAWHADELPSFVDLRPHLTPVEDQGDLGSCTANALAGAIEYLENRIRGDATDVSRLFIYWNERDLDGATDQDHGACLADGVKSLREQGVCAEKLWPYDPKRVFEAPHEHCYNDAERHVIDEAHKVKIDLHDMRHCLAEGYPFVFGLQVYDSFQDIAKDGIVKMPKKGTHEHCGGHAMLCVGYSDKDRMFVVRNSWGPSWGDQGYCYIPYDYLTDPQYAHDAWTLRKAHDLDFNQGAGGAELPHGETDSFFDDNDEHTVSLEDGDADNQDEDEVDSDDVDSDDSETDDSDSDDVDSDDSDTDDSDSDDAADTEEDLADDPEIARLNAEIAQADAEIAASDAEIARLDAEIAELDRRAAEDGATEDSGSEEDPADAETDPEIARLDAEIAQLDAEIAELDRELAEGEDPPKKKPRKK